MTVCYATLQASLIRQIWDVVEQTQSTVLLYLDDQALVGQIVDQVQLQRSLNGQERKGVRDYLSHRTPLIREMAADRCGISFR